MWSPKRNNTKELTYKTERDSQTEGTNLMFVRGQGGGKDGVEGTIREFGMETYTLLYLKWITDKGLLRGTGNSAQSYRPAWVGGEFGEESVQFSRSVVSDSLRPCGLQHARLPSRVFSNTTWRRMDTCIYMAESFDCSLEAITILLTG